MTKAAEGALIFFIAAAAFLFSPLVLRAMREEARKPRPSATATPVETAAAQKAVPAAAIAPPTDVPVDFLPAYFALDPAAPVDAAGAHAVFNPADPYGGLPQTGGYDLVASYCSACHSLRVVMAQGLTKERWDRLLVWMVERQGMPEPEPADRQAILDYLAANFAPAG